jgi:hypothetical protein
MIYVYVITINSEVIEVTTDEDAVQAYRDDHVNSEFLDILEIHINPDERRVWHWDMESIWEGME